MLYFIFLCTGRKYNTQNNTNVLLKSYTYIILYFFLSHHTLCIYLLDDDGEQYWSRNNSILMICGVYYGYDDI